MATTLQTPKHATYDVVIIGGAIMGSSAAWFLTQQRDFDGKILVIEKDQTYANSSTAHTNSCMRQQFSSALNVQISQFAADFVKNMRAYMGGDARVPELKIRNFGYMYLADTENFANTLRENQHIQVAAGAATTLMTPDEIAREYPFYNVDDIVLGSINLHDEGYFDGSAVFDWLRRMARENGAEYVTNEVVGIAKNATDTRVERITLKSGETIGCGQLVNASGPRAAKTAAMAGITLPVEPRKRYSWVFSAEKPLARDLPLTIDPSGIHVHQYGDGTYQCGAHTAHDPAVDFDDFNMDFTFWQDHVWPTLATRIPQFEAIRVQSEWAGHYAFNTFDHNAIVGPHTEVSNFLFLNGFSGHGLQQAPAMGRAIAELLVHGEFRSLDLSPFRFGRIPDNAPLIEKAVI